MRRKNFDRKLICAATLTVLCLFTASPASSQVVDSGAADESLQCVGFAVSGVNPGDSLNVREGPGVSFEIVTTLEPDEEAIAIGLTEQVGNSVWYQIGMSSCAPVGWVNSRFLELVPGTTAAPVTTEATSTNPPTTPAQTGESQTATEPAIELSLFTTGLLGLGVFGLLTGVIMAVRGRQRERMNERPPPGMAGPPGGPYYLAPVSRRETDPQVIQIRGEPKPVRRRTDLPGDLTEQPVSAFPDVPDVLPDDLSSSPLAQSEPEKITREAARLSGTTSLAAGNATEDEPSS
jgi:hypothetical protein